MLLNAKKIIIDPSSNLAFSTLYTVTLGVGIRDLENDAIDSPTSFSFTTTGAPDTTPPTVSSRSPTANC